MNPKKILFYTDTPMLGGTENQMLTLAKFLPKEKYPVTLACSKYTALNGWCQQWIEAGFEVIRFPVAYKHDPRHFLYLKQVAKDFDLLHVHLWNPGAARYSFFALKNKPIVVTEHDPFVLSGLKGWIKNACSKKISAVIVASKASKEIVLKQSPELAEKIAVIPHGLDNDAWKESFNAVDVSAFRRDELGLTEGEVAILCVAELNERKGQQYLIEAFGRVSKKHPEAKLFLVGSGPQENEFKMQSLALGDRVRFLGRRKDVPALLKSCDVFVLPSKREAFGLVVLEASLAHKAIIGSQVGGIEEIILNGKTGLLVAPQSIEQLETALLEFIENSSLRDTIGKQAYEHVTATYNARRMADATSLIYDAL